MEWIDVNDRLPENPNDFHLQYLSIGRVIIGMQYDSKWYKDDGTEKPDDIEITHWMPLPEPPEKDNKPIIFE